MYTYTITPVSADGQKGSDIGPASGLTISPVPTGADAVGSGSNVAVTWNDVTGQFTGYKLYRGGTLIYTGLSASYSDIGANTSGAVHVYTVASYNSSGMSAQSDPATMGAAPSAPSGLSGTASDKQVILSWTAPAGAVSGYEVYQDNK